MLQLAETDVHLAAAVEDKTAAITLVANALTNAGYVKADYLTAMLQREQQTSTYLGQGIATPHGTTQSRDLVKKTGVQIFQFPQGIDWNVGEKAYVVIGIAARTTEHLALLRQLTRILDDDRVTKQLAVTQSVDEFIQLLMGKRQSAALQFDPSLISLNVAVEDLLSLQLVNIQHLSQVGAVNKDFIASTVNQPALHLGQGIWISDSSAGCIKNAIAISRPAEVFSYHQQPVAMLITVSMVDAQIEPVLTHLARYLIEQKTSELLNAEPDELISLLTTPLATAQQPTVPVHSIELVIRNEHGLHTRPGGVLVSVAKKFNSEILLTNLNGDGKAVNGRSLTKVATLGAKKGHRLRVSASGEDAEQALAAIEQAINAGLGE